MPSRREAAAEAADVLRATASLLDRQTDARVRLAADARREWRGRARAQFDDELARLVREAVGLAEACRRAAARAEVP